jgi:hypothetical protein
MKENNTMRVEVRSDLPHDRIFLVDVDEVLGYLNTDLPPETVSQLYEFGKLMLDQIRGLRTSYDSKLTSCLGWGTATVAVMLAGITNWIGPGWAHTLASAGTAFAILSVIAAMFGLKSFAGLEWPSEKDWFQSDYFQWPDRLKRHHIVTMLGAHQSYSRRMQRKGYALMLAEYFLVSSALLLASAAFVKRY